MKVVDTATGDAEAGAAQDQQPSPIETQSQVEQQPQVEHPELKLQPLDENANNPFKKDVVAADPTPEQQPKKNTWVWILLGILGVFLIGALLYVNATSITAKSTNTNRNTNKNEIAYNSNKNSNSNNTTSNTNKNANANKSSNANTATKPKETSTEPSMTSGQRNALSSAQSYLNHMAFSRSGLIEQLEFEGYAHEDAVYAVDHCGANWTTQADKAAKQYLSHMSFSRDGLIEQLEFEGFTHEEAVHGADAAYAGNSTPSASGAGSSSPSVGQKNALSKAQSYLSFTSFSHDGLVEQLEYDGFTHEEAVYAADNCDANWMDQAAKKAQSYLDLMAFSRDGLIEQLEYDGFTPEEAAHGAAAVGY